jgi:hypothetical protein
MANSKAGYYGIDDKTKTLKMVKSEAEMEKKDADFDKRLSWVEKIVYGIVGLSGISGLVGFIFSVLKVLKVF